MALTCAAAGPCRRPASTIFINAHGSFPLCDQHDGLARSLVGLAGERANAIVVDLPEAVR